MPSSSWLVPVSQPVVPNPEASVLVRAYRRSVPVWIRRRLNRRIPASWRQGVKSAVAGVRFEFVHGLKHRMSRARHPEFYRGAATEVVADQTRAKVAHVVDRPTPLGARQENLRRVVDVLDRAGIDYFAVRGLNDRRAVVAVRSTDGPAVCEALSDTLRTSGGYWSVLARGQGATQLHPGTRSITWSSVSDEVALQLTWFQTDDQHVVLLGEKYACEIEFWVEDPDDEGMLLAPRRNRVSREISMSEPVVELTDGAFTRLVAVGQESGPTVRTRGPLGARRPDDIAFPIDVVFTWVDGADPAWKQRHDAALDRGYHEESSNTSRYLNLDELRYALRSIEQYAPWVRHVYVVTDDQRPAWLADAPEGLTVVDHREIFSDPAALPSFNSHAIESQLHHIEGLSEHFIYLNDDMLFASEVIPSTFFHANGISKFFPSPAHIPAGPPTQVDEPAAIAGKNNRDLLKKRFDTTVTQKMKHAPYALRRSVLAEIEQEFESEHRTTMGNKMREQTDLSIASSLYHYFAFQTGRSVPSNLKYTYVDLGKPAARRELGLLLARRNREAICLNSTAATDEISQEELFTFLNAYFPLPSRFER